jgi:hypothetical protein
MLSARSIGTAGVLLVAITARVEAQTPATSFAALQDHLKPGRTVTISEIAPSPSGKPSTIKGEIVELRPGAIVVKAKGKTTTFAEQTVVQVSERYIYSPRALTIGLAVGAAGGFALDRLLVKSIGADTSFGADDALVVGIGAAVGAAFALHPRERVVYRKAGTPTLTLLPIAGRKQFGVAGHIRF